MARKSFILKLLFDVKPMKDGFLDFVHIRNSTPSINLAPVQKREFKVSCGRVEARDLHPKKRGEGTFFNEFRYAGVRERKIYVNKKRFPLKNFLRPLAIGVVCLLVIYGGLMKFLLFDKYGELQTLGKEVYQNLSLGVASFKNFDFDAGSRQIKTAEVALVALEKAVGQASFLEAFYSPPFIFIRNLRSMVETSVALADDISSFTDRGISDLFGKGIDMKTVRDMNKKVEKIAHTTPKIMGNIGNLAFFPGMAQLSSSLRSEYFAIQNELQDSDAHLEDLITALGGDDDSKHYLVVFQNPSEIRATGGFWGSYMLLEIKQGKVISMDIRNIYDLDGQLLEKIAPPKQLLSITPQWGTRDANWFFDFMSSAKKGVEFFEKSRLISEKNIKVDAVFAINTKVVEELLEKIGAVRIPEYNIDITSENFVKEIQYAIEYGSDRKEFGDPKRILKVFVPLFLERISTLEDKKEIISIVKRMLEEKEVQVAIFNQKLQNAAAALRGAGYDGHIIETNALEDYLAFVNSNVAGGKSDYVVSQNIKANIMIKDDGYVHHQIIVTRKHNGEGADLGLWQSQNKNYFRLYVPTSAQLSYATGATSREYRNKEKGVLDDPIISEIESGVKTIKSGSKLETYIMEGKRVFAGWFNILAGSQKQLVFQYKTKFLEIYEYPSEGAEYRFIFQKQSGVNGSIDVSVQAPDGYIFKENSKKIYTTHFEKDPRVLEIQLTIIPE